MQAQIKFCGLNSKEAVEAAIRLKASHAGFVFYPASPRHLAFDKAAELVARLPASIPSVAVLVDPNDALLSQLTSLVKPAFFQLHGKETPERLAEIRSNHPAIKLIKALSVRTGDDIAQAGQFLKVADMLMFDAKPPRLPEMLPGGNGLTFDWELLQGREFALPWLLSGGLNPGNVADALRITGATMVDVSSGIESAPGVKDPALMEAFAGAVRA